VSRFGEGAAAGVDLGVEAGADQVADAGMVAVRQGGLRRPHAADLGELGLDAAGEVGGFGVGAGEQQHVLAAQVVGEPHRGRAVAGGFVVGAADAAGSYGSSQILASSVTSMSNPCSGRPCICRSAPDSR
jgi:hypothetical protein